jgi:hypothetical protein
MKKPRFSLALARRILVFDILLLSLLILTTRFATGLHETYGHALTALLCGGQVRAVFVSKFGGGYTSTNLGGLADISPAARFAFSLSGIAANLVTGLIAAILITGGGKYGNTAARRPVRNLLGGLFAAASLLGAWAYLVLGLYYGAGDPVSWAPGIVVPPAVWLPLLLVSPAVSYVGLRGYLQVQESIFPAKNAFRRIAVTALTLGIATIAYAGLYFGFGESLAAADAPEIHRAREIRRIAAEKRAALQKRLTQTRPDLSSEEIERIVEETPVFVKQTEIPRRFPLIPVQALLFACGGIYAAYRTGVRKIPPGTAFPEIPAVIGAFTSAGIVLWLLHFIGGYR